MSVAFRQPGIILILFILVAFGYYPRALAQTAGQIEAIRKLVQKIDEDISQAEQSPDASTTFLTELSANKNLSPYPAVGFTRGLSSFTTPSATARKCLTQIDC
jgi:hypothetical protein